MTEMMACNGEAQNYFRGPAPLGVQGGAGPQVPQGRGSRAAGPSPAPILETKGAGEPPVAMETARASSGNPWQPGCCQDELWRTGSPSTRFLGRRAPNWGERPTRAGEGGPRDRARLPWIPKVKGHVTLLSRHPAPSGTQGESPLCPGGPRVTTSPSWVLALTIPDLPLLSWKLRR